MTYASSLTLGRRLGVGLFGIILAACANAPAPETEAVASASPPATNTAAASAAFDPATLVNLPTTVDYEPPEGITYRADSFLSENVRLTAQWFHASENDGQTLPTIVMAHGWGGTAAGFRRDAVDLAHAGYLVAVFDYRGWGESDSRVVLTTPRPSDATPGATYTAQVTELRGYIDPWEQVEDWYNAISYVATQPMVDGSRIGVRGSSFSGGHIVYVAAHEPRVKAIVAQVPGMEGRPNAPYTPDPAAAIEAANAAAGRLTNGEQGYPVAGAQEVGNLVGAPIGNKVVRWAPVEMAERVSQPTLFIMAENEELFSNELTGIKACEMVTGPRKAIMIPEISHYGIYGAERELAIKTAIDWFDRYLKPDGASTRIPVDRSEPERGDCRAEFVRPPGVGAPATQ